MLVRSTGLGKTQMLANVEIIQFSRGEPDFDKQPFAEDMLEMVIKSYEPVIWRIRVFMEPKDVWQLAKLILRSSKIKLMLWMLKRNTNKEVKNEVKG